MANVEQILAKKYEAMQSSRVSHGMIMMTNDEMNRVHPDNPVLVSVPAADVRAYEKQGYRKYVPKAAEPKEAKPAKEKKKSQGENPGEAQIAGQSGVDDEPNEL